MAVPHESGNFADLLDPRFRRIYQEAYSQLPDMLPMLFSMDPSNGRGDERWSEIGAFGDLSEFTGQVSYDSVSQGYDTVATHREWASGFQVRRKLFDDDQYGTMEQLPRGLGRAAARTRQKHGARVLNNAFTNDTYFYVRSEGVAVCSNSHTSTASDADTSSGFDNLATAALSATAVAAARIQMVGLRDDRGNRISLVPDEIWIPPDLYETAYEIVASMGKVDSAENNRNVHEGQYTIYEWNYLSDANNWFMCDSALRREFVKWVDRVTPEMAMVEEFDTLIGKWRLYGRWLNSVNDWRWIIGSQVS